MASVIRSALFVPAANARALAKAPGLDADAVIIDLEDAVAPGEKEAARAAALRALRNQGWKAPVRAVRINALHSPWGEADVLALAPAAVDALVIPKVESAAMVRQVLSVMARASFAPGKRAPLLWAMVETPRGILNLEDIATYAAELGLCVLVAGTNDLAKALRCDGVGEAREALLCHLSRLVLVARSFDLGVLDGVYNAFEDASGFAREARQGRRLGFAGKSLIHPAQIDPANTIFDSSEDDLIRAKAIVHAFGLKKNAGKGVLNLHGEMVERLHLHEAQALLDSASLVFAKSSPAKRKKNA